MYNRYVKSGGFDFGPGDGSFHETPENEPVFEAVHGAETQNEQSQSQGPLKGLFGGNIKLPDFDSDTILLLVLVYFLISDDKEENSSKKNISDTLLIIGALLLLGF